MSWSTPCFRVLTWLATCCCVASSLELAFQPKANPPIATKPSTIIAGNCQEAPLLFSTTYSSLIAGNSPLLGSRSAALNPNCNLFEVPTDTKKGACAEPKRPKREGGNEVARDLSTGRRAGRGSGPPVRIPGCRQ